MADDSQDTQDLSASDDDDDYGGRWVGRVGDYIKLSVCGEWQSWSWKGVVGSEKEKEIAVNVIIQICR